MKTSGIKIAVLVMLCVAVAFELWHFRSSQNSVQQHPRSIAKNQIPFVLLPASEVTGLARFFAGPNAKIEPWEPTVGDMDDVNASLGQIPLLSSRDPVISRHIDTATAYYRQYGAVIIDGRKSFVLNAFCPSAEDESGMWRKHLIVARGGAKCHWKALFDVPTQKYTALAVDEAR